MKEIQVMLYWENNVSFQVTSKEDGQGAPTLDIVKLDENGHLPELWPAITDVVERYVKALMTRIGNDMKL